MKNRRRETKSGETQMFAGLVKCSDCGSALNVSRNAKTGKYTSFSCWVYKNYGKERCTSHAIGYKTLYNIVLETLDGRQNVRQYKKKNILRCLKTKWQKKQLRILNQSKMN